MSSKAREVIRARIRDRIRAAQHLEPGLGAVRLEAPAPTKTKAEIQDELVAAGIDFPKKATKAELEALQQAGPTTPDLEDIVAEDIEAAKS